LNKPDKVPDLLVMVFWVHTVTPVSALVLTDLASDPATDPDLITARVPTSTFMRDVVVDTEAVREADALVLVRVLPNVEDARGN
jgi:hypothetical protein